MKRHLIEDLSSHLKPNQENDQENLKWNVRKTWEKSTSFLLFLGFGKTGAGGFTEVISTHYTY